MAAPLSYTPPTRPDTAAADELEDLTRALHESGLLRVLAGVARNYPELLKLLMDNLDADALRSLIALGGATKGLDPVEAERLAAGIRQARVDAVTASSGKAEGPLALLKRLSDPDTRRGLAAALATLRAIGGALPR